MAKKTKKKDYFEDYPLREKISKANFTLKLKNGGKSLRYTPEHFGNGLQRNIKEMITDLSWKMSKNIQMQELQALSKEDREIHFDWVLSEVNKELQARKESMLDLMHKFYN